MADGIAEMKPTVISLERFTEQGTLGLFDCYTNVDLGDAPCVGFGMKELTNSMLRPIANIVILSYLENRFLRKRSEDVGDPFRIDADECQEMLDNPYSAKALETYFRRFRKRKGGPIAATQNFQKFYENPHGRAIVQNSDTKIIFGQQEGDLKFCAEMFGLTEGELEFLDLGLKHHCIIKQPKYSCRAVTQFSPWEQEIFFPQHGG
jgi:type IV secretory pathway VirB4 component